MSEASKIEFAPDKSANDGGAHYLEYFEDLNNQIAFQKKTTLTKKQVTIVEDKNKIIEGDENFAKINH